MSEIFEMLPPSHAINIIGPHIIIRPISPAEITSNYIGWLNNPDINQYLEVRDGSQNEKTVIAYINHLRSQPNLEMFAILTRESERHIGNMTISRVDQAKTAAYGLMLGEPQAWKMGIGAECTALMLELLFEHIGVRRIYGEAFAENTRAINLLERFGFVQEGLFRQHVLNANGGFADVKAFGMFAPEWQNNRKVAKGILNASKIIWE